MRLIAILIALFGGYIIWYGLFTPYQDWYEQLTYSDVQQLVKLGGGFMFGGLFLYVYARKNKNK